MWVHHRPGTQLVCRIDRQPPRWHKEVIDFCAEKGIAPSVQVIPAQSINAARTTSSPRRRATATSSTCGRSAPERITGAPRVDENRDMRAAKPGAVV